jgi:glycosyltransferase involved in cell wall biosynthesis
VISVVLPVRDAARTVCEQIDALAVQDHRGPWELIVVDGGSRDDSMVRVRARLRRFPRARVVDGRGDARNGASLARNRGAAAARGWLIAFCDADDVVAPGWLDALARAARDAGVVAGRLDVDALNTPAVRRRHERAGAPVHRFLPSASSANCAVRADVLRALGGFDEDHPGAEDRDLSWRAQLEGHRLTFAPGAVVAYRHRDGLWSTARQRYRWGMSDARLFRDFAGAGMERESVAEAARAWASLAGMVPALPWSSARRGQWVVRAAHRCGHVAGSVREGVVFP